MKENYFLLLPREAIFFLTWWQNDMPVRNTVAEEIMPTAFGFCSGIGAVTLDPPVPSLPGSRRIILRAEPGKNGEKATPCWVTADEKPSNLQGASAFSIRRGNQIYWKHFPVQHLRAWKQGFVVQLPSGEMTATSPSNFKETQTLVYAGSILN